MVKHLLLFQSFFWFFLFNDVVVGGRLIGGDSSVEEKNTFTSKASLVRYWNKEINGGSLVSEFLISKASPLNAIESATFTIENSLPDFCSAANLFCFPDLSSKFHSTLDDEKPGISFKGFHSHSLGDNFIGYRRAYAQKNDGETVNKLVVPGLFFRESMLKEGTVVSLPEMKDVMPERSFLPRSIVSKLPFSVSKIGEIKEIFHAGENSMMEDIITNAVTECERPPSIGEMKQCVGAAEDMIDFATKVLGRSVVLRTTENAAGSKGRVVIGKVNGGKITKSVSCHQSLYPYLLYYCHSVPKVRVYEVDLLESNSKTKINHGIAICHFDTSSWSPNHMAFIALGSKPGRIEVCHWMFENEMNWTVAD
ncbi:Polygalacturonase 1 beta-like protein 3 [Cardamine amara subsp. amara]|uniref:Polygalacturonase 1 beta-like protein 3 n=1 Tax=Cardamine amara subsp. amara TaxID=228776 RepID=A0ABD1B641_CARAN